MSHEFEQGFFSRGKAAWHSLGKVLDGIPTVEEAVKLSGADRPVERRQMYYLSDVGGEYIPVESHVVNVRGDVQMGVVGARYQIVQDVEAFKFLQPMLDDGTLALDAGVSLREGRSFALTAKLRDSFTSEVIPGDPMESYLVFSNSHDGSSPVTIGFTRIRVVCMNTNRAFLSASKAADGHSLRFKHTKSVHLGIETARETIDCVKATWKVEDSVFQAMARKPMSGLEFSRFARKLVTPGQQEVPIDDLHGKTRSILESLEANWATWDGPKEAEGTAWAAYNAVTRFVDHQKYQDDERRAFEYSMSGAGATLRDAAYDLLTATVMA